MTVPVREADAGGEHVDLHRPSDIDRRRFDTIARKTAIDRLCEAWIVDAADRLSERKQRGAVPVDEGGAVAGHAIRKPRCRLPGDVVEPHLEIEQNVTQLFYCSQIRLVGGDAIHCHRSQDDKRQLARQYRVLPLVMAGDEQLQVIAKVLVDETTQFLGGGVGTQGYLLGDGYGIAFGEGVDLRSII